MNRAFSRRRDRLLTYQTMRQGRVSAFRPAACPQCGAESSLGEWNQNLQVCPKCGFHGPIGAYYRLAGILDPGSFQELEEKLSPADPLAFPGYPAKLAALEEETGLRDAAVAALGRIEGRRAVFAVLDSRFLMGSMGTAVGEKVTRAAEYAARKKLPLILFSASGGARMQEGIFSLMQMAKTAAAIQQFQSRGGLYISCLTHPTTGGVTASFASLGDIMLAEPGALIGFAGPRVIEQTIKEQLPEGFQRAEYLLDHGFLDQIVPRQEWRSVLSRLLALHEKGGRP
ncbi:MAG: acetyl-CoA carboxylase carboxyltransferase subunit beta [Oscillospiraceae bacterium]|nr:acetyl-CoA carboxylase carboxyltransferase subunit beta [Oscillospiraceae bacterium]